MAGYIEDRWLNKKPDPVTGKRERTDLWGKGKRYRVKGIPGVKDRSFDRAEEAKRWLAKAQTDAGRGEFVDPRDGSILLKDYVERHWWPNHKLRGTTEATTETRLSHVLDHLGRLPLNAIGYERLGAWVVTLRKSLRASTAEQCWHLLSAILGAAVKAGRLARNPCSVHIELRPTPGAERPARALGRVAAASLHDKLPPRYQLLATLGFGCGLRIGEALAVAEGDFEGDELHVQRQIAILRGKPVFKLPKGEKTRRVPVVAEVAQEAKAHMASLKPQMVGLPWLDLDASEAKLEQMEVRAFPLLTYTRERNHVTPGYFQHHVWKPALAAAGLLKILEEAADRGKAYPLWEPSRELAFHIARHTYASTLLEFGENPVTVSKWLGHANPSITLKYYAHFMPDAGSRGLNALETWFRKAA